MKKLYSFAFIMAACVTFAQTTLKVKPRIGSELPKNQSAVQAKLNPGPNQVNMLTGNITCGTQYVPSNTVTLVFTLAFTNTDFEYGDSLALTFPAGMTPTGTSNQPDFAPITDNGTGQTPEAYNGVNGQTISWGDDDNNYGGIESLGNAGGVTSYTFDVTVNVGAITGTQNVAYHVSGDGWGANPGGMNGMIPVLESGSNDVELLSVQSAAVNCGLGNEQVVVMIRNNGSNPASAFPLGYMVNGGAPAVEFFGGMIPPMGVASYTFTTLANLSSIGTKAIGVALAMSGDAAPANDTMTYYTENYAAHDANASAYTMDFEASEAALLQYWAVEDANLDGAAWALINTYNQSGNSCLRKPGSAATDDDWAFTGCIDLTGGQTYALTYYYKNFELTAPCSLEVYYGVDGNSSAMSNLVVQNPIPTDTMYQMVNVNISPATTGSYHLGFHAYAAAGTSSIRIDNINLSLATGISSIKKSNLLVSPNPSNGVFNVFLPENNSKLVVSNLIGETVHTEANLNEGNNSIDLRNIPTGTYLITVQGNGKAYTSKIVITE